MRKRHHLVLATVICTIVGTLLYLAPATSAVASTTQTTKVYVDQNPAARTVALGAGDSLTVGTAQYLGLKTIAPYVQTTVYRRYYVACHMIIYGMVKDCMAGSIIYAPYYAVCNTTCSIIGYRGTHSCDYAGSYSYGYSMTITSCGNHWYGTNGTPSKGVMWSQYKLCLVGGFGCTTKMWYLNDYWTGSITGPHT